MARLNNKERYHRDLSPSNDTSFMVDWEIEKERMSIRVTEPNGQRTIDNQIQELVSTIELGPQWLEEVLAIISLKDEVEKVKKNRQAAQEKLRRMAKAYVDGIFPDEEYNRQRKLLEMELESLVVLGANAAEDAGKMIMNLRELSLIHI